MVSSQTLPRSSLSMACFGLGDLVGVAVDDQLDAGAPFSRGMNPLFRGP